MKEEQSCRSYYRHIKENKENVAMLTRLHFVIIPIISSSVVGFFHTFSRIKRSNVITPLFLSPFYRLFYSVPFSTFD